MRVYNVDSNVHAFFCHSVIRATTMQLSDCDMICFHYTTNTRQDANLYQDLSSIADNRQAVFPACDA